MKRFLSLLLLFPMVVSAEETNPDEYRDCAKYTFDEAIATTSKEGNIVSFTFSDKTTRKSGTNADCGRVEVEEETPTSPGGGNDDDRIDGFMPVVPDEEGGDF